MIQFMIETAQTLGKWDFVTAVNMLQVNDIKGDAMKAAIKQLKEMGAM